MKSLLRALALLPTLSLAQPPEPPLGSGNFCLYALPTDGPSTRFINLGIVQYVEVRTDALVITYGGGNLGSGYEARIPVKIRDEALALIDKLRQQARECAHPILRLP